MYALKAFGEFILLQIKSIQYKFSFSFPKNDFIAAIWQGVPQNKTFFPFSNSFLTCLYIPAVSD